MVTFVELLGIMLGGASVFGLIVGAFSIHNGRVTRKLILEEEKRTQEILSRIEETSNKSTEILNRNTQILNVNTRMLAKMVKKMLK